MCCRGWWSHDYNDIKSGDQYRWDHFKSNLKNDRNTDSESESSELTDFDFGGIFLLNNVTGVIMLVSNLCYVSKWMVLRRHFQDGLIMQSRLLIQPETYCQTIAGAGGVSEVCKEAFLTNTRIIDDDPNV